MDFNHHQQSFRLILLTFLVRSLFIALVVSTHGEFRPFDDDFQNKKPRAGVRKQRPITVITGHRPAIRQSTCQNRPPGTVTQIHTKECSPGKLKVALLNARSVCNKAVLIVDFIIDNTIDVLFITETWLNRENEAVLSDLLPTGFSYTRTDRDDGRQGGGIMCVHKGT